MVRNQAAPRRRAATRGSAAPARTRPGRRPRRRAGRASASARGCRPRRGAAAPAPRSGRCRSSGRRGSFEPYRARRRLFPRNKTRATGGRTGRDRPRRAGDRRPHSSLHFTEIAACRFLASPGSPASRARSRSPRSALAGGLAAAAGPKAYVGNFKDSTVSVVDTGAGAVAEDDPVAAGPHGMAVSPRRPLGRSSPATASSSMSVIDTASDTRRPHDRGRRRRRTASPCCPTARRSWSASTAPTRSPSSTPRAAPSSRRCRSPSRTRSRSGPTASSPTSPRRSRASSRWSWSTSRRAAWRAGSTSTSRRAIPSSATTASTSTSPSPASTPCA